jgi:hypothetical protein
LVDGVRRNPQVRPSEVNSNRQRPTILDIHFLITAIEKKKGKIYAAR